MQDDQRPAITVSDQDLGFWSKVRSGQLVGEKCRECGKVRLFPALHCSACLSQKSDPLYLTGQGVIASACRFHRAYFKELTDAVPYTVILVRLQDGHLVYSNLVDEPDSPPVIGTKVQAVLRPYQETAGLVLFEPMLL